MICEIVKFVLNTLKTALLYLHKAPGLNLQKKSIQI